VLERALILDPMDGLAWLGAVPRPADVAGAAAESKEHHGDPEDPA